MVRFEKSLPPLRNTHVFRCWTLLLLRAVVVDLRSGRRLGACGGSVRSSCALKRLLVELESFFGFLLDLAVVGRRTDVPHHLCDGGPFRPLIDLLYTAVFSVRAKVLDKTTLKNVIKETNLIKET